MCATNRKCNEGGKKITRECSNQITRVNERKRASERARAHPLTLCVRAEMQTNERAKSRNGLKFDSLCQISSVIYRINLHGKTIADNGGRRWETLCEIKRHTEIERKKLNRENKRRVTFNTHTQKSSVGRSKKKKQQQNQKSNSKFKFSKPNYAICRANVC